MNRKVCPECGQHALKIATRCPGCGFDLTTVVAKEAEEPADPARLYRLAGIAGVILLVVAAVAVGALTRETGNQPAPVTTAGPVQVDTSQQAEAAATPVDSSERRPSQHDDSVTAPVSAAPLTAVPPPEQRSPPQQGEELEVRWASTWINVREGQGTDYPVVRVLRPGERVEVTRSERGWRFVYIDGEPVGYADNSLLQPDSLVGG